MPEPADAAQKVVLDAIWDLLSRSGGWPSFHELDQHLYRVHDIDAAHQLTILPPGLLYGVDAGRRMHIAGTTTIGLTAAGAHATGRAQRELDLFLAVVRHAVALQREYDPPSDQPDLQAGLVSADVARLLKLTLPEDAALLKRLAAILYTERWGWSGFSGLGTDTWQVRVGREVRRFRNVPDIATYWELRPKHWLPDQPVPAAMRFPAPSTSMPASVEPEAEDGTATERQGAVSQPTRDSAANRSRRSSQRVDVLVVTALPEEFKAAREAASAGDPGGSGVARWEQRDLDGSSPYLWGEYRIDGEPRFSVAVARPTRMGGRAMGPFAARLVDRLRPASVAMCGVCAGDPASTALGDVVVGTPVYEWDEGKHSGFGFEGDHRQFSLSSRWQRAAQDFDPVGLASYGEASEHEALLWFLEQLYRGQQPRIHPALSRYFPRGTWRPRLELLEKQGLIRREPTGEAVLTSDGSDHVLRRLYDDVDGPQRLPLGVLVAPMASGSAVIADPDGWGRLKAMGVRSITAIEMEAATIATVAHDRELSWIVVKGVMDHADARKDDRYKPFAARASAQVMFALLERLVTKTDTNRQRSTDMVGAAEIATVRTKASATVPAAVVAAGDSAGEPFTDATMDPSTGTSAQPESVERENAVRSAESYLRIGPFSRKGLIRQLSSDAGDGYSPEASTFAVDSLDIDFDEQAARSAQRYLKTGAFSRRGLIQQLESDAGEGFTDSQAVYGVNKAGL